MDCSLLKYLFLNICASQFYIIGLVIYVRLSTSFIPTFNFSCLTVGYIDNI
jgi:hypothetical protein